MSEENVQQETTEDIEDAIDQATEAVAVQANELSDLESAGTAGDGQIPGSARTLGFDGIGGPLGTDLLDNQLVNGFGKDVMDEETDKKHIQKSHTIL